MILVSQDFRPRRLLTQLGLVVPGDLKTVREVVGVTTDSRLVTVPALVEAGVTANEVGVVAVQAERDSRDGVTSSVSSRDLEACDLKASAA